MEEKEYNSLLLQLHKTDPELRDAFYEEYHKDRTAPRDVLLTRAGANLGRLNDIEKQLSSPVPNPLTEAFETNEAGLRKILDPDSKTSWMRAGTKELIKAAIRGGYVDEPRYQPTEAEKEKTRKQFADFLKILERESTIQGRRNAVSEYENTEFRKDPKGWAGKMLSDFLLRGYVQRAKEQALQGKGASAYIGGGLSAQDVATMGLDVGANAAYGLGGAGLAGVVARNGLRTTGTILGSDLAAGVVGGTADVMNRAFNTESGVEPYEYVTEPAASGIANALMTPGMLRNTMWGATSFLGGGKVGDISRRNAIKKAADYASGVGGWSEARLADVLEEIGRPQDPRKLPTTKAVRDKLNTMAAKWDEGKAAVLDDPESPFDALQALYENNTYPTVVKQEGDVLRVKVDDNDARFARALGNRIDELKDALANAGAQESGAIKRRLDYFENARDIFSNGLATPRELLENTTPATSRVRPVVSQPSAGTGYSRRFKLRTGQEAQDAEMMWDYVKNAKNGGATNIVDHPMADELQSLRDRYPAFDEYISSLHTRKDPKATSTWRSVGEGEVIPGDQRVAPGGIARGVINTALKPSLVIAAKSKYDQPDTSFEAVERKIKMLEEKKPRATRAALEWKFDPNLKTDEQLTDVERNLVNTYRAMLNQRATEGR